jgi:hypothetical protein
VASFVVSAAAAGDVGAAADRVVGWAKAGDEARAAAHAKI